MTQDISRPRGHSSAPQFHYESKLPTPRTRCHSSPPQFHYKTIHPTPRIRLDKLQEQVRALIGLISTDPITDRRESAVITLKSWMSGIAAIERIQINSLGKETRCLKRCASYLSSCFVGVASPVAAAAVAAVAALAIVPLLL